MAALGTNILSAFIVLKKFALGPRLLRIYPVPRGPSGRDYEPNNLEFFCDFLIKSISNAVSLSIYMSPVVLFYMFRKGLMTASQIMYLSKVFATLGVGVSILLIGRGIDRYRNPHYQRFMKILDEARQDPEFKEQLQAYDFEFFAWLVDFKWNESSLAPMKYRQSAEKNDDVPFTWKFVQLPLKAFDYFVAHGFARPMIYPGSVKLLQNAFADTILKGRAYLIEKNGRRAKVLTEDGNEIDTMFLDKRSIEYNGETLVITCEGNAAFYELGCMVVPRIAGYSILGWNHPGFAGSSGLPYPDPEKKAVDAVVKYAVTKLGFPLENIIFFAWSIGGYSASYAAMAYPQIKGIILDATFDNVLPLATARMPSVLLSTVKRVVRDYFPLNVEQQLLRYPGPVRLIRRFQEEIITTKSFEPATNRGNFLLVNLLRYRYPGIMTEESVNAAWEFLAAPNFQVQAAVKERYRYNEEACENAIKLATNGQWPTFPCHAGEEWEPEFRCNVALFLVSKHMDHFDATHNTPLPSSYFRFPWHY
ncbi:phosphatidylserine lipase ABHD16A-like [Rhopilema esculentum]|uniref:phosphatidylserine lipase ABHD16A-like n=1 Tax=Rhopilema esculentum TaxID=499914 RepID=UPI0031DB0D11|eukprot:gene10686-19454_t